jgi:hypothetical protein
MIWELVEIEEIGMEVTEVTPMMIVALIKALRQVIVA